MDAFGRALEVACAHQVRAECARAGLPEGCSEPAEPTRLRAAIDAQIAAWRSLQGFDPGAVIAAIRCLRAPLPPGEQWKARLLQGLSDYWDDGVVSTDHLAAARAIAPAGALIGIGAPRDPVWRALEGP